MTEDQAKQLEQDLEEVVDLHFNFHWENGYDKKAKKIEKHKALIVDHIMTYADEILFVLQKHGIEPHREE